MSSTNCCNFSHPASITLAYDMPVGTIGILLYLFITTLWNRVVIPALWGKGWEHFRDLPCSPSQQVSYLNSPLNALFWHPSFWKPDTRTSTQSHLVCPDTTMSGGLTWSPDTLCVVPPRWRGHCISPCGNGANLFLAQVIRDISLWQYYSF